MSGAEIWPSRPARPARCRCGAALIYGLAEGVPERVDVDALTPEGEYAALCDGRQTFVLTGGRLLIRDQFRIKRPPKGPIFATHKCGTRIRPQYRQALKTPHLKWEFANDEPGF
jgi:hypothetical protein